MKKYIAAFLHRGLIFGGFGPIGTAVVYLILSYTIKDFTVSGKEMFTVVISTYMLAFVHAGASVITGIEEWPLAKCMAYHFALLYMAYTVCYLINAWIPFDLKVFFVYTVIFVSAYLSVWIIVLMCVRATSKKFNKSLKN